MSGTPHLPAQQPASYIPGSHNLPKKLWREIEIPLLILLGLVSIVLGFIGFQRYFINTAEPSSFGRNLYAAVELFELRGGSVPSPIPWELEVSRWLSPAVAMYAVVLGLAALFQTQFQFLRLRFTSGHVILCGLGKKGFLLAKALRAEGRSVVVIDPDGNNPYTQVCRELGIITLAGDGRDEFILRKAGVRRASHLIAICGEDGTNAEIAMKARRLITGRRKGELKCTVHIQDPKLWILLRQHEFAAEKSQAFRLDFFNVYAQGARQLLKDFPIVKPVSGKRTLAPHLLVIGLGRLGEQLVIHSARQWVSFHEETGLKLQISVVDPNAQRKIEGLCQDYSLIERTCDFEIHPIDSSSPEFHRMKFFDSQGNKACISHVFICMEDETVGLSTALFLLERTQAENLQILVRMEEDAGLASLLRGVQGIQGRFTNLRVFGLLESSCKPNLLNDVSHESVARAIHNEYIRREMEKGLTSEVNPSIRDWDSLSEDLREMNRNQADEIGVKLNTIDCDVIPWRDYGANRFSFTPQETELLARNEHEHWCREKISQGWKYGPVRDERRKAHPSLIAWEDPGLSETEKDKDRDTIQQIPRFLALAGFQIYRVTTTAERSGLF